VRIVPKKQPLLVNSYLRRKLMKLGNMMVINNHVSSIGIGYVVKLPWRTDTKSLYETHS
jgi:hypothetical protein